MQQSNQDEPIAFVDKDGKPLVVYGKPVIRTSDNQTFNAHYEWNPDSSSIVTTVPDSEPFGVAFSVANDFTPEAIVDEVLPFLNAAADDITPIQVPDDDSDFPEVKLDAPIATVATAPDDYPEFAKEASSSPVATNFPTVAAHYSVPKATGLQDFIPEANADVRIQDKAHAHIKLPSRPKKGNHSLVINEILFIHTSF